MARYYFDIDGSVRITDPEGTELDGDGTALRAEALAAAREMTADAALRGIDITARVFAIRNEAGQVLLTVPFRDAVVPEA